MTEVLMNHQPCFKFIKLLATLSSLCIIWLLHIIHMCTHIYLVYAAIAMIISTAIPMRVTNSPSERPTVVLVLVSNLLTHCNGNYFIIYDTYPLHLHLLRHSG